ncbi:MAG: FKBP-type peptidyl-prolyl cis-trans isomerase [Bacteroidota bacterium]|nr:FKBP-type peptidyl-prolyl cis-trans isomerase [Bacteroidota bacterium]
MRFIILPAAILLAVQAYGQTTLELRTRKDSISYAIGLNIGRNFKMQNIDIDMDLLAAGMKDMLAEMPRLTESKAEEIVMSYQQELLAKQEIALAKESEKNKSEGDAFLAENKKKPGVVTTPSGLQYKVLVEGTGPKPTAADKVKTHYTGMFIDGTVFDSSVKRGEPVVFPVGGVIKGWTEALQMMPLGSKWMLYIPPELAYGKEGSGGVIGPNVTLVFEVELLSIEK